MTQSVLCDKQKQIQRILETASHATGYLAYLGDKQFFFNSNHTAFIMYGIQGRSWIVAGDPVGDESTFPTLLADFKTHCHQNGGRLVFCPVSHAELYQKAGFTLFKVGEEARIPLANFSLEGSHRSYLRYMNRKLQKQGWQFSIILPKDIPLHMPQFNRVSEEWRSKKGGREKGFALGYFKPDYLQHFHLAVVHRNMHIVAFSNVWPGNELGIDMMRYSHDAPRTVIDYLLVQLMLWGKTQGYPYLNQGLVPLSGLDKSHSLWQKTGSWIYQNCENFYNFQGLRNHKQKFAPEWESRYLAVEGGWQLSKALLDTAAIISGGIRGILS